MAEHEEHFESLERQAEAARFGMWLFLASEALLFGGLFTLYAAYRAHFPKAFAEAVRDNTTYLGSLNTVVLITSSFLVALAVHALRHRKPRRAIYLVLSTCFLAAVFLAIKFTEYSIHFSSSGVVSIWSMSAPIDTTRTRSGYFSPNTARSVLM